VGGLQLTMEESDVAKKKIYAGNSYGVGMTVFRYPLEGNTCIQGQDNELPKGWSPRNLSPFGGRASTAPGKEGKMIGLKLTDLIAADNLDATVNASDMMRSGFYSASQPRVPEKFRQRLLQVRGLDPKSPSPRRMPPMANWKGLAPPKKLRQGLTLLEKEAARSSRNSWLFRQNDLRYVRGVLTPECDLK